MLVITVYWKIVWCCCLHILFMKCFPLEFVELSNSYHATEIHIKLFPFHVFLFIWTLHYCNSAHRRIFFQINYFYYIIYSTNINQDNLSFWSKYGREMFHLALTFHNRVFNQMIPSLSQFMDEFWWFSILNIYIFSLLIRYTSTLSLLV